MIPPAIRAELRAHAVAEAPNECCGLVLVREDVAFARSYLLLFQNRAFPAIEMGMDPSIRDPQIRAKIVQMASAFPPGEPKSVAVVASSASVSGNTMTSTVSFQYEYPARWVVADVVVERKGQASVVKGVHVQPLREPVERINRFTFTGKSPRQVAALAIVVLVLLFVLYAAVLAIRTPAPSLQWAGPTSQPLGQRYGGL